jgi:subtilisin family serine protease
MLLTSGVAVTQTAPGTHAAPPETEQVGGGVIPDEYIVVLDEDALDENGKKPVEVANDDEAQHPGLEVEQVYGEALEGYAAEIPEDEVADVENDPGVLFVSPNRRYEQAAEPRPQDLRFLPAINRVEADKSSTKSGDHKGRVNVDVAVIDSGIDVEHRELNVVGGKSCASGADYDEDPGDFGHGTGVAGLIGAKDNAYDGVGVAPGARLYAVKVSNRLFVTEASLLCGINWVSARADKIEVVNMSVGGRGSDDGNCGINNHDPLHYAICHSVKKGLTYVVAAGNDGVNFSKREIPAAYDEVLTATAMQDTDGKPGGLFGDDVATPFSNYTTVGSPDAVHTIAAPGSFVFTTFPGNDFTFANGTSFSAPIVAGAAALYKSHHPNAKPQKVMREVHHEAMKQPRSYGFKGDPHRPIGNRNYGYLLYVGDF